MRKVAVHIEENCIQSFIKIGLFWFEICQFLVKLLTWKFLADNFIVVITNVILPSYWHLMDVGRHYTRRYEEYIYQQV